MKKDRIREMSIEVTVGAFMFMVLLVLGVFTIVLSRESFFTRNYEKEVIFQNVSGLREGDNVFVRGLDVGKIKRMQIVNEGVSLVVSLEIPLKIHEDYKVEILPSSVLGGRYLLIDEGSANRPLINQKQPLYGQEPLELTKEATDTFNSLKDALNEGGILTNLIKTMSDVQYMAHRVKEGKGTFGRLFMEDDIYENLAIIVADIRDVSDRLKRGEGTVGRLLSPDETVYRDIRQAVSNLNHVSERLANGEGVLGQLLSDDNELDSQLHETITSLSEAAATLNSNKGTLGKLLNEDTLYNEVKTLIVEIRAAVDDFRETSPITTFTSIFFGAF